MSENKDLLFLLEKAKLSLTEEEKERFNKDIEVFRSNLSILDEFDLEDEEPIRYPINKKENLLREDEDFYNEPKGILENASMTKDEHIFLPNKKEEK